MSALEEIEKLAEIIAKAAQSDKIKLDHKVDALKSLAPYYAVLSKGKKPAPEDDSGSIEALASTIQAADEANDGRSIPSGTRRRNN